MHFLISANTDIGLTRQTNQDSLAALSLNTPQGPMALAVLCDGMGGLEQGEIASASVVNAFRRWAKEELPKLCYAPLEDSLIRAHWEQLLQMQNQTIKNYGARQGIRLGTTVVAMLLTQQRCYVMHVGDSRAYEITGTVRRMTEDHTLVAREVSMGRMSPEQARVDPKRNVLLQCVGASEYVQPDMYCCDVQPDTVYMLCSDGFYHEITPEEFRDYLGPEAVPDAAAMRRNAQNLIALNKQRQERDNISVALIRTV